MIEYTLYKDCDIPWLSSLPTHWVTKRAKYLFSLLDRPVEPHYEVITCFRDGVVTLRKNRRQTGFTESLKETGYQGIKAGDLVIHQMDAFAGSVGVSNSDGKSTPVYSVCSPKEELSPYYYAYIIREMARTNYILSLAKGIRQRSTDFRFPTFARCLLPVPPIEEQNAIVAYLDKKCAEIDELVTRRQAIIERLKELKQSIIANAVTKGLNPNVSMKDSGTAWQGKVPAHWEIRKLKYTFSERTEKNHPDEPILCATQSHGVIPQSLYKNRVVVVNKGFEGLKFVKCGDFVISLRSFEGGIEYAYYQGIISAAYTVLTPNIEEQAYFLKWLFKSKPFIQLLQTCVNGIREGQNINYQALSRKFIVLPPLKEQRMIVDYLDKKCAEIDELVARQEQIIEKLKELKTSTIAHVVTGKVDVRDAI